MTGCMRSCLIALAAIVAFTQTASAQDGPDYVRNLSPGSIARLRLDSDERVEGKLLRVGFDTALVATESGSRKIAILAVDSLWVRGHHLRRGTIIGAAVGATIGAAFGIMVGLGSCDYGQSCTEGYFVVVPLGAVIFGVPGALAGSLVGSLTPRWILRHP
jgi:hypothetical protein